MSMREDLHEGKPREECGVFAVYGHEEAARVAFFGLFALQHRGQESAGIASADGCQVWEHKGMGLASEVFREDILSKLPGRLAIGHVRYSTTGSSILSNAQPFLVHHADEYYALAHNGNLINALELRAELEQRGSIFQSTMDSEVIVHLMAPHLKEGLEEALTKALVQVQGAYSIVMLTRNRVVAVRDPRGFRPLSLGQFNGGWVVASETCAFDLVGAKYIRDVQPGEIIIIDEAGLHSLTPFPKEKPSYCIFELIYFARPDSQVFGENVYLCRKRLGHNLARESRPDVDLVMPFPDSGNYAALGYAEESGLPFEEPLRGADLHPAESGDAGFRRPGQAQSGEAAHRRQKDRDRRGFHHPGDDQPESRPPSARLRRQGDPHGCELPPDALSLPLRDRFFDAGGAYRRRKGRRGGHRLLHRSGRPSLPLHRGDGSGHGHSPGKLLPRLLCRRLSPDAPEDIREVLLRRAHVLKEMGISPQTPF
jgi:amidophosphoribosyltransferase